MDPSTSQCQEFGSFAGPTQHMRVEEVGGGGRGRGHWRGAYLRATNRRYKRPRSLSESKRPPVTACEGGVREKK